MAPSQEKTPLLSGGNNNNKNAYYFQTVEKKGSNFRATSDQDGGQMVETLPAGSTEEDFAPRIIGISNKVSDVIVIVTVVRGRSWWRFAKVLLSEALVVVWSIGIETTRQNYDLESIYLTFTASSLIPF